MRNDRGSIIPLMLGMVVIAMLMVAGSVAAGDAFVQQRDLQDTCDGAAIAGANAVDLTASRQHQSDSLPLGDVQGAVARYLNRDPDRLSVQVEATVMPSPAGDVVALDCRQRVAVAFGRVFGLGAGLDHHVTATARTPVLAP